MAPARAAESRSPALSQSGTSESAAASPLPTTRSVRPRRLKRLKVRERSGSWSSAGATAVKKGRWNWTENTVPWKELVQT